MTTKEAAELIGKSATATVKLNGKQMTMHVVIKDVRQQYGRVDFLCQPLNGLGETWIKNSNLTFTVLCS